MKASIVAILLAASGMFGQTVTHTTETTQESDTKMKLDGDRTRVVTNNQSTTRDSDSTGSSTVDSRKKSTVSKQKHGKKVESTTSSHSTSTVQP
jgi:hypothetical protein